MATLSRPGSRLALRLPLRRSRAATPLVYRIENTAPDISEQHEHSRSSWDDSAILELRGTIVQGIGISKRRCDHVEKVTEGTRGIESSSCVLQMSSVVNCMSSNPSSHGHHRLDTNLSSEMATLVPRHLSRKLNVRRIYWINSVLGSESSKNAERRQPKIMMALLRYGYC
jgi:hypothetical protein